MIFRTAQAKALAATAVTSLAAALTVGLTTASGAAAGGGRGHHVRLDRVFVIVLENHSKHSVIGDHTPYLTALAHRYGQATQYYGVTHPSEPNYVAMISGSNWWTNNDDPTNRFHHTNLVDGLQARHISWGAYEEALPHTGSLADFWPSESQPLYASKHNPFVLFTDIRDNPARLAHVKPYTALAGDLNSRHAPRFVFIVPDQCNDMHGGVTAHIKGHPETPCPYSNANDDRNDIRLKHNADRFVRGAVTTITHSRAWTRHSAIFIVADEGDYNGDKVNGGWASPAGCCDSPVLPAGDPDISPKWPGGLYGGGLVPAVVIDPAGPRHFTSGTAYNHYSMLRTIEDAWRLPELAFTADHAQVKTMNEFLAGH